MGKWIDGLRLRRRLLLACVPAALTVVAGCGGTGDDASTTPTRTVVQVQHAPKDRWTYARARFNEMCAGCHTLADARATGHRFNLDNAVGVEEEHVRFTIKHGEPGMPSYGGVVSKREYEELVAYLVAVAGRKRGGDDYWAWQIRLRLDGENWTPGDMRRLEEKWAKREVGANKPGD